MNVNLNRKQMEPDFQERLHFHKCMLRIIERYAAAWKDLNSIELGLILDPECVCITPDIDSKGINDVVRFHKGWFEKISESSLSILSAKSSLIRNTESEYFMESQIQLGTDHIEPLFDFSIIHTEVSILAIIGLGGTFI